MLNKSVIRTMLVAAALAFAAAGVSGCIPSDAALGGHLTDSSSGDSAVGVAVQAYDASTDQPVGQATYSDQNGDFWFSQSELPVGSYKIEFYPGQPQFYPDSPDLTGAQTVAVDGSHTTKVNGSLHLSTYSVSGTVTDTSSDPIADAKVQVLTTSGTRIGSATTAADGTYTIAGVDATHYRVKVSATLYATEYFGSDTGPNQGFPVDQQRPVAGVNATGIDVQLPLASDIRGTLMAGSAPVPGATVFLMADDGSGESPAAVGFESTSTGDDGTFVFAHLPARNYFVVIADPEGRFDSFVFGGTGLDATTGTVESTTAGGETSLGTINVLGKDCAGPFATTSVDFSGQDLSGKQLMGCDLSGDNFTNANLSHANLTGANLPGATLTGADLSDADLSGAQYANSSIVGATLTGANLSNLGDYYGPFYEQTLSGKDLSGVNFSGDDLYVSNLDSATVTGATFTGANLTDATMTNMVGLSTTVIGSDQSAGLASATLTGVNFTGSNLDFSGVDLSSKSLSADTFAGVDFKGANLTGADFGGASLTGANLSNADLSGAQYVNSSIVGATLVGADLSNLGDYYTPLNNQTFSGKDLSGVNFTGDDLRVSNLDSATVTGATFTGADLGDATMTNMVGLSTTVIGSDQSAGLASARLTSVNFTGSNLDFSGVDLSGKDLVGDTFAGVDFTGANLAGADFAGASLTGANLTGADLSGAQYVNSSIVGATLVGANLSNLGDYYTVEQPDVLG